MARRKTPSGRKPSAAMPGNRVPLLVIVMHGKPMGRVPMKRGKQSKSKR
jgi:hypothetical protein